MTKKGPKTSTSQTTFYFNAGPTMARAIAEYRDVILNLGLDVMGSEVWGARANATQDVLYPELLSLMKADVMLVFSVGATPTVWLKAGFGAGAGLRLILIGDVDVPDDLKRFFILRVKTWDDLAENNFFKLGDGFFKKGRMYANNF